MTRSDLVSKRLSVGTAFGNRMRDAQFRAHLRSIGWRNPQHIVTALDHEPVSDVVNRMLVNGTPSPVLIIIPAEAEPFGFRFMWAGVKTDEQDVAPIPVPATASIGMLYSALQPSGEYIPGEWSQRVLFERVCA
jgi:hypothetical protein